MSSKISSAKDVYQQVASDSLSVEIVFSAISDNKSLSLFNIIGFMSQVIHQMMIRTTHRRDSYITYESDSQAILHAYQPIVDAGLITKKRARFVLTSLGRVVYETHKTIGVAIQNRWRLQAIDSLENTLITQECLLKKDTNLSIRY